MAAYIDGIFDATTKDAILKSKLLVVGAGGIGCELLKNLVLTGFEDIHVIDLDTIDISNLNRQFLFQRTHIGKSKALVAKESAQKLNSKAKIQAYHDSITELAYNVEFYSQFSVVANALDNMAARKHVNRMCLAADIPLIESGTAGYLGQVTVYKKKITECYECVPRPSPKDFPTCTIRNTPSEPIHCVVWAKHLFNQLFGEEDPHQEVSPDPKDQLTSDGVPELPPPDEGEKISTREWAKNCNYDAKSLFTKLFFDDIKYLLEMKHLWEHRKPPTPLMWDNLPDAVPGSSLQEQETPIMRDQEVWSIRECSRVFEDSLSILSKRVAADSDKDLTWDKDDKECMDFVSACANIRAHCFSITQLSRFKIKSMAGNIIPAIATTNAIIAGLIVLQLIKVLRNQLDQCRTVILNKTVTKSRNVLLVPYEPEPPNKKCFVCCPQCPEVRIKANISTLTVKTLEDKILKGALNMIAPDVFCDDGKGTILVSSDPGEEMDSGLKEKTLNELSIHQGTRLQCDDFFQDFAVSVYMIPDKEMSDQEFEIISDISELKPSEEKKDDNAKEEGEASGSIEDDNDIIVEDYECFIVDADANPSPAKKRRYEDEEKVPHKKIKAGPLTLQPMLS